MKPLLKKLIPSRIRAWLGARTFVQNNRYRFFYYFVLRRRLRKQLAGGSRSAIARGPKVLVPLIETSHYQHFQVLALAKALQLRGAQVKVLICGQTLAGCEIKSIRNAHVADPCWRCRFNERHALRSFDLDIVRLSDVVPQEEIEAARASAQSPATTAAFKRHGVDLSQAVQDSVTRYFYGAIPHDAAAIDAVRRDHLTTALVAIEAARRIDASWAPDAVLTHMYCYTPWEPFFKYYQQRGSRFKSVSITQFDFRALVLSSFELFSSTDRFEQYVRSRSRPTLDPQERAALQKFLDERVGGTSRIFRQEGYFDAAADTASLAQRLRIDRTKRNVFLFSNVYWDVGLSDCSALYSDVLTWVLETIELARGRDDVHLYIKPHPAEVFDSSSSLKGVSQVIRERYPTLPQNVTIIEPQWKLNTYRLFQFIDVGVIFNGTLGLEMMLSGIPVISTGRTTHHGLGLAREPASVAEYRDALLGKSSAPAINRDRLELFAYFYFLRTLIPWRLTKQSYADDFDGFTIASLADLEPGRDPYLDHLCKCILEPQAAVAEAWQDESAVRAAAHSSYASSTR